MSLADDYVAALAPWMTPDLETYLRAIGGMFAQVEFFSADSDSGPGWAVLFDVSRAPLSVLPYTAMYVGERLPVGIDLIGAREWIRDAPNQRRGTLMSVFLAAQRTLTGQRTVQVRERQGGEDQISVSTYDTETPNPAQVLRDILSVLPADIVLTYTAFSGQNWADVQTAGITWQGVRALWPTWDLVRSAHAPSTTFTRPRPTT